MESDSRGSTLHPGDLGQVTQPLWIPAAQPADTVPPGFPHHVLGESYETVVEKYTGNSKILDKCEGGGQQQMLSAIGPIPAP